MKKMLKTMLRHAVLLTAIAGSAAACCGGGDYEPDTNLIVEVDAPGAEGQKKLCGAEVVAVIDDDEELPLEEEQVEGGCRYHGVVPDNSAYEIRAAHPELGNATDVGVPNPACSVATPADDTDLNLQLARPAVQELRLAQPIEKPQRNL